MKTAEMGRQLLGAILNSKEPKRLIESSGLSARELGDDLLAAGWDLAGELANRGDQVNAMTVSLLGQTKHTLRGDDLPVLQSIEARTVISPTTFMQLARQLRMHVQGQLVGAAMVELGKEILAGAEAGRSHAKFEALRQSYTRLHAKGLSGAEVVAKAFNEFDERKDKNRELYLPLGLKALDELTGGAPPKYCMLLGSPGAMKSGVMGACLERRVEHHDARPLVISLEDGDTWPFKRFMAKRLDMKLRDVFNKEFPDGARAAEVGADLSRQFGQAWFLTRDHVRAPEDIVRECWMHLAQHNITEVWLDNARAVKNEPRNKWEQRRDAIMRMHELFADFSERAKIPFFLLIHTSREYEKRTQGKGPPIMSDIQESSAAEADVRFLLALWEKDGATRITVGKHTEGEKGATVEFDRLKESALIDPDSGRVVNLQAEEQKENEEKASRRNAAAVSQGFERRKLAKSYIEQNPEFAPVRKTKEKKPEPQAALPLELPVGAGPEKKP